MDRVHATDTGLLADALSAGGHHLPMPCRSRHTCGKCGIYVAGDVDPAGDTEAALLQLSPQPLLPGYTYRLACLATINGEVAVIASSVSGVVVADVGMDLVAYDGDAPETYGCAIDIGTTTVTVLVFRLGNNELLADDSQLNHQAAHGSDVLSRIDAANQLGVEPLQKLIVEELATMLHEALDRVGVDGSEVTRVTITGNTTMLHLLIGLSVQSLGVFPFTPGTLFGYTVPAGTVFAFLDKAELYLPPGISTYVGPDIVCGLLTTGLGLHGKNELLVDVGTNGEMALAAHGRLWCCSTAAGPAFEGAEISAGMPALPGAIDDVWLEDGAISFDTVAHKRPKGICGTGLIGAINAYLDLGVIDETGAMEGKSVEVGTSLISITQADVRKLQLAKAAIAAGIDTLLHEAGLTADGLDTLHLAGGFGSYLQPVPAAGIGMIPHALIEKSTPAGNTALTGAVLLTLSVKARRAAEERARGANEVSLATSPVFMERYIENMAFREEE